MAGQVVQVLIDRGAAEGEARGLVRALTRLPENRLGRLPSPIRRRTTVAMPTELDAWFTASLDGQSLADVFPDLDRDRAAFLASIGPTSLVGSDLCGFGGRGRREGRAEPRGGAADWRRPHGPGSSHTEMSDHPGVHFSRGTPSPIAQEGNAPTHRDGVRVRCPRRTRRASLRVGGRANPRRGPLGQPLAGHLPPPGPRSGRVWQPRDGQAVPRQRLWPLRHDRQCLGMGQ